jgi:hypothetical protein
VRNPYLERLQAQKQHPASPSIASKPSFEGFEGDQGYRISENTWSRSLAMMPTTPTTSLKNATTAYPQNLQKLSSPSVPMPMPTLPDAPDGAGPTVEIVELPAAGRRYRKAFTRLLVEPPAHISVERWHRAVEDGRSFLAAWGEQADALGWDSRDLFGLDIPPADPRPSYSRLSRYDNTGLCWLLQGKEVIAITADTATIRNPRTDAITVYRRFNKPALGPLGDSLKDYIA